jgi:hypothetical protein
MYHVFNSLASKHTVEIEHYIVNKDGRCFSSKPLNCMNILQALACNIDRVKDKRSVNWFFMTFQFGRIREWPLFPGKLGEPSTLGFD